METAKVLLLQVALMIVLSGIGFLLFKTGKITKAGSKTLGNILIFVSLPIVVFRGFMVERTTERMIGLGISTAASIIILGIGMLISYLLNKKDPIANFACCFSNPGFFGLPLVIASISEEAVFYVAPFIGVLNVLQLTYGVFLITRDKKNISIKKILTAPTMIGLLLGLMFFFIQIPVPDFFKQILTYGAGINTPLAMFTIGVYLAQTNLLHMLKRLSNYKISIIKLVLIPLVAFGLLSIIPGEYSQLKLALLICAACPVGSNIAVLAEMNDGDYPYAVETVVISTLFSVASIPLMVLLATAVWGM